MEEEKIQLGAVIARLRKQAGLTQAELAEQLGYSDKAVSKWERGDSLPDALTIRRLSQVFGVSADELLGVTPSAPAERPRASRPVILGLCSTLVWFLALLAYVLCTALKVRSGWMAFLYAVPVNAVVLLSLLSAWRSFRWNPLLISVIVWGSLAGIYVSLLVYLQLNIPTLLLLGIPGQIAICLWFRMFPKKEDHNG